MKLSHSAVRREEEDDVMIDRFYTIMKRKGRQQQQHKHNDMIHNKDESILLNPNKELNKARGLQSLSLWLAELRKKLKTLLELRASIDWGIHTLCNALLCVCSLNVVVIFPFFCAP